MDGKAAKNEAIIQQYLDGTLFEDVRADFTEQVRSPLPYEGTGRGMRRMAVSLIEILAVCLVAVMIFYLPGWGFIPVGIAAIGAVWLWETRTVYEMALCEAVLIFSETAMLLDRPLRVRKHHGEIQAYREIMVLQYGDAVGIQWDVDGHYIAVEGSPVSVRTYADGQTEAEDCPGELGFETGMMTCEKRDMILAELVRTTGWAVDKK